MSRFTQEQLIEKLRQAQQDPESNADDIRVLTEALNSQANINTRGYTREDLLTQRAQAERAGDALGMDVINREINRIDQGINSDIPGQSSPLPEGGAVFQPTQSRAPSNTQPVAGNPPPEPTLREKINTAAYGLGDVALDAAGGVAGDVFGGLAGAAQPLITPLTDTKTPLKDATDRIKWVQDQFNWELKTDAGKRYSQAINETLEPIGTAINKGMQTMGDYAFEKTGSPLLATTAYTAIPAAFEALGIKGLRATGKAKRDALTDSPAAINAAAPDLKTLTDRKNMAYKAIDDAEVTMPADDIQTLKDRMYDKAFGMGLDPNPKDGNTAKAMNFLNGLEHDIREGELPVTHMDIIRQRARDVSDSASGNESAIGNMFIREIDHYLDNKGWELAMERGPNIGKMYRHARSLQRRLYKFNDIEDVFVKAIEEGEKNPSNLFGQSLPDKPSADYISDNFKQILKDREKRKHFTEAERETMRSVTQGRNKTEKWLRKIGYFAPFQDQVKAHSAALGGHIGGGVIAGAIGGAPGVGAFVALPAVGQVSYNLSRKLMLDNAKLLKSMVNAGLDAENVVKQYFKHVPKSKRNKDELTELFLKTDLNNADWAKLKKYSKRERMVDDAYYEAAKIKNRLYRDTAILFPAYLNKDRREQSFTEGSFRFPVGNSQQPAAEPDFQYRMQANN